MLVRSVFGDYSVEAVDSFEEAVGGFPGCSFVVDDRVLALRRGAFSCVPEGRLLPFRACESAKTIDGAVNIASFLHKSGVDRSSRVVVVGGGITQETAGTACCLYRRGVRWVLFPTTLLSMADSAIGGKCSLNFMGLKNMLGVFYPPERVLVDPSFVLTLPEDRIVDGLGEIFKSCLLEPDCRGLAFGLSVEAVGKPGFVEKYAFKSLDIKRRIVEEDELEGGRRMLLNYGHTFGHALEAVSENSFSHGTAVLWGIDAANYLSMRMGFLGRGDFEAIREHVFGVLLRYRIRDVFRLLLSMGSKGVLGAVGMDKKAAGGFVSFVLLRSIGDPFVERIAVDGRLESIFDDYVASSCERLNLKRN